MTETHVDKGSSYRVSLTIPCLAEYVSIARLAILGVAGRLPFSYDEVEDVRLAVGEACTHAVERAAAQWPQSDIHEPEVSDIKIECAITGSTLAIEICDHVPGDPDAAVQDDQEAEAFEEAGVDRQHLSALLMEILVDEMHVKRRPDGTCVRLVKHASPS